MTFPDAEARPLLRPLELLDYIPGMGRSALYEAIRRGDLPSVKIGRRLYVPTGAIRAAWALDTEVIPGAVVDDELRPLALVPNVDTPPAAA